MNNNTTFYLKGFLLGTTISLCFLGISLLFAWTEPSSNPPNGNVASPLNVGSTSQIKSGKLGIATDGIDPNYGLTVGNSGNQLGIKASGFSYFEKDIQVGTTVIKSDGSVSTNLNADKIDDYDAADLLAAAGQCPYSECYVSCQSNNDASCDTGYTRLVLTCAGTGCGNCNSHINTLQFVSGCVIGWKSWTSAGCGSYGAYSCEYLQIGLGGITTQGSAFCYDGWNQANLPSSCAICCK